MGIFVIVILIEVIRRFGREWDRYIVRSAQASRQNQLAAQPRHAAASELSPTSSASHEKVPSGAVPPHAPELDSSMYGYPARAGLRGSAARFWARNPRRFRPSLLQQLIRSLIYGVQFTGAYLVMLMAMTFNGYILLAICVGGLFGHFISTWDALAFDVDSKDDLYFMALDGGAADYQTGARFPKAPTKHLGQGDCHPDDISKAGEHTTNAGYTGSCCH